MSASIADVVGRILGKGEVKSGDLDSRTPPRNAEDARRGFRWSAHLVLEGAGHDNDLSLSSPIILERIGAFLRGDRVENEHVAVDVLRFQ